MATSSPDLLSKPVPAVRGATTVGPSLRVVPPGRNGNGASAHRPAAHLVFPEGYVPGISRAMRTLTEQIQPLVEDEAPVLVLGETGVGKEVVAQVLHESSTRSSGPFVAVNCAAIPQELMEAEMFGIVRGAASGVAPRPGQFQRARRGTLFLDEIGELPLQLQAKLLRALQGREIQPVGGPPVRVETRVVAATNSNLEHKMERGQFRRDLYYRVAAFVLRVPPLRERREDIPLLAKSFLRSFANDAGTGAPPITEGALKALAAYEWPGNVRELEHEVRRLVRYSQDGQTIEREALSERVLEAPAAVPSSLRLDLHTAHLERRLIRVALGRTGGRRTAAARLLGISRNGLALKLARLGLQGGSEGRSDESAEAMILEGVS